MWLQFLALEDINFSLCTQLIRIIKNETINYILLWKFFRVELNSNSAQTQLIST